MPPRSRRHTLQSQLLTWTLGTLLLVWTAMIGSGFGAGYHESDELVDGLLASTATVLLNQSDNHFDLSDTTPYHHEYQRALSVMVWDREGRLLSNTGTAPAPTFSDAEGYATLHLGPPGQSWRSFARWQRPDMARRVMVLVRMTDRDALAWDIGGQVARPGLLLLPVVMIALALAVQRGLRPLRQLSHEVQALDVHHSVPLPTAARQQEFLAVVEAINDLSNRYRTALQREQQLASELAHEMRTPLASLSLHARSLRDTLDDQERAASLARIEHDALRAGHILGQLLALARASRTELAETAQPLDLSVLACSAIADYGQSALDSDHELALQAPESLMLRGHPVLLELALRNLVENALSHTPAGSLVEVQIDAAGRWLQVCDDGVRRRARPAAATPASDAAARNRPPLGLGLGLGHRVVAKIADVHGARFEQVSAPEGFDTCYRITFPA